VKIYDPVAKRELSSVTIYVTPEEARQLSYDAAELAADPSRHHEHVGDGQCSREVTIAVYTKANITMFDMESRQLLADEVGE